MKSLVLLFGLFVFNAQGQEVPVPGSREFKEVHTLIQPAESETKWLQIPWMTDLWKARQLAAEQGKPIFLWEMDGHPMGCT